MKRTSLALAISLAAAVSSVSAALPASSDPTFIDIPQLPGGYVLGGSVFYLNHSPSNGDLDFASVNSIFKTDFSSKVANVNLGYDWGFSANIGYIFPNTGNDINLNYFYLDSNSSNFITPPAEGILSELNDVTFINSNDVPISNENATAEHRVTQVDLTGGQYINVGCRLRLHPIAGIRYADVERFYTLSEAAAASLTIPDIGTFDILNLSDIEEESDFRGAGPLAGIDTSYYLGRGFGVIGHGDAAILIGGLGPITNVASFNAVTDEATGDIVSALNSFVLSAKSVTRVVPVTDLKLGLDYTYTINNTNDSDLSMEIGYQTSEYFNAVDRLSTISNVMPGLIFKNSTSDLGLDGPYITLTFHA